MKRHLLLVVLLALLTGCESAKYGMMEKFGWHKRDILVDRVEEARQSQEKAKEQFRDALEQFASVVQVEGGNLRQKYDKLRSELDDSEARAADVRKRIAAVRSVANALFKEWEKELEEYSSAELRRRSESQLRQTRQRYDQLMRAMETAESKMEPVLSAFRDQVLFLKHNLNARAIASLRGVHLELETDINRLIADMERSIAEADAFIRAMAEE